ncbi:helix-turn-helix domain-containing protein [Actinomycetospora sp. TBRC 11914]|uniref:helix-turn-helix transcriptional regulator n=1 Tax=Actinomycetospora sp. TBRC 11914 TaxID=2729387 RepID=UPI00145E5AF3|nr:helix-turn-helix domain-containing protein [Actinomycetospora sp. TBRC 11914]NMO90599.1 helix-turn-helix domain-containing protein [Actinomycetospora sp. TBRC 11914]
MDNRSEVSEFLTTRRARITPQEAGLPSYDGSTRRVPGLRRQEVATLAGLSVEYYAQLERGKLQGVSEAVLDALSRALQLDDAERAHLFDLCRAANTTARAKRRGPRTVRPAVARIVEAITDIPAIVRNPRLDIVTANPLGYALYAPLFPDPRHPDPTAPANMARFTFFDPRAGDFHPDWTAAAERAVAILRTEAGRDPFDRDLSDLVGELSTRSEAFRTLWARHDVRLHQNGVKRFNHPIVGSLNFDFETLDVAADQGLTMTVYSPEPGSPSADANALLASWIATGDADGHRAAQRHESA